MVTMQAMMQTKDPREQVGEIFHRVFRDNSGRDNSGSNKTDGLFKGVEWQGTVITIGKIGEAGSAGIILPKNLGESSFWAPVMGQFKSELEKIGLEVTGQGWRNTWADGKRLEYYGFDVLRVK